MPNALLNIKTSLRNVSYNRALRILNKYVLAEKEINKLFNCTKDFCRKYCHKKPIGCCDYNWYNYGLPKGRTGRIFKKLRKKMSKKFHNKNQCTYFSFDKGCDLEYFKSPYCLGMACPTLCQKIKDDFGIIYDSAKSINFFRKILREDISYKKIRSFLVVILKNRGHSKKRNPNTRGS